MTTTVTITTDDMTIAAKLIAIAGGTATTGTGPGSPPVNNFPADPALAPFPSPENSQQIILAGKIAGVPYLKDSLGRIHTMAIDAFGVAEYWLNGVSLQPNWSGHADSPPAQLLVRQGGVYVFLASGATQMVNATGGVYNAAVPPAWTGTTGGGVPVPTLPGLPTPSAIAPGSSGNVINCGSGMPLATLSAAIPTAKAGDTVKLAPGTYTDTPPAWTVPLLIDLGGSTFNATGQTATLAHGKGLLVPGADSIIQNGTITGVAMDQTVGQLTSAIRPDDGCGYLTIKGVVAHGNQCGIGHGGFAIVIEVDDSDISNNGLTGTNTGGLTHDLYVGAECVKLTLNNVVANGANEAHAIKYRGPQLIVQGGTFAAANGKPFDLPNGSTVPFKITGATIIKATSDPDHGALSYGEEGATNGLAGGTINGGKIEANCPSPFINGPGGTITLAGVTITGGPITGQGVTINVTS